MQNAHVPIAPAVRYPVSLLNYYEYNFNWNIKYHPAIDALCGVNSKTRYSITKPKSIHNFEKVLGILDGLRLRKTKTDDVYLENLRQKMLHESRVGFYLLFSPTRFYVSPTSWSHEII